MSPFKAAGTQAPSPAQAWQGRGPQDAAQATKGLLLPRGSDPLPPPQFSVYAASPAPSSAKGRLRETPRAGEEKVFHRLNGLTRGLHLSICETGEEGRMN